MKGVDEVPPFRDNTARYSTILEKIQPLEEELHEAVAALDKSQARSDEGRLFWALHSSCCSLSLIPIFWPGLVSGFWCIFSEARRLSPVIVRFRTSD